MTIAPPDAEARRAIAPVICYPNDSLPQPDLGLYTQALAGAELVETSIRGSSSVFNGARSQRYEKCTRRHVVEQRPMIEKPGVVGQLVTHLSPKDPSKLFRNPVFDTGRTAGEIESADQTPDPLPV